MEFIITDQPDFDLDITPPFTTYCPGDDALIQAIPIGGVGGEMIAQGISDPFIYEWLHVGSTATQVMNPDTTTTYFVQVTDVCDNDTASVEIAVTQYDQLFANGVITCIRCCSQI